MRNNYLKQAFHYSAFLFTLIFCFAVQTKPSIDDYAALPGVSQMRLSPNGELIAFIKTSADKDSVVIFSLKEGKMMTGATLETLSPRNLYFANDDQLIIVASRYRHVLGIRGQIDMSTAFAMNAHNGKIHQLLTPGDVIYVGQGGLGDIVGLSADKKYALMPAYVGVTNRLVQSRLALVRTSLTKRRSPRIVEKGTTTTIGYFVNTKGQVVAEERFDNDRNLHRIFSKKSGEWEEIYRKETDIRQISPVGLTPDQTKLVIRAGNNDTDRKVLYTMSLINGEVSEPLFAREDADIEGIIFDGIYRTVRGVRYSGFKPSYEFFDKKLESRVAKVTGIFSDQSVNLSDWSSDFSDIVISVSGASSSGDYYLSKRGQPLKFLTSKRKQIKASDINAIAEFNYKAKDGLNIPSLLTIPAVKDINNLPAIMLPHGGPESYDRNEFSWLSQALASQGYLVIQPQFRGSSGFGLAHTRAGYGEWGKKMQSDLTDGIDILVAEGIVDPARVCILGWSYGGYAALAGAAFTPNLYKCAVSINGVSDLALMMKQEKSDYGRNHWVLSYWENQLTAGGADKQDILSSASPVNYVEQIVVPVLLIHGEKDKVVNIDQSERMMDALAELDKSVEFIEFEGEGHSISGSEARRTVLRTVIKFINNHIGESASPK